jgi:hypothetical protein
VAFTYTKKDLINLLEKNNDFKITSVRKDHIFPYVIKDYINHTYNKKTIIKLMPKTIFSYLESILGWHWLITFKK